MKKIILIIILSLSSYLFSTIIYVNIDAFGLNNGTNWTDAYTSLHVAMDIAVAGDEIWVAQGIYYATTYFELRTGIEVYGGFNGTETLFSERDWETNKTILSGDIGQDDVNTDGNFIAETWAHIVGSNADHIILADMGVDSTARMDGFIITAGWATTGYGGGGVLNWGSSPSYYNLEI